MFCLGKNINFSSFAAVIAVCTIFILTLYSLYTQIILILPLINVQCLQDV